MFKHALYAALLSATFLVAPCLAQSQPSAPICAGKNGYLASGNVRTFLIRPDRLTPATSMSRENRGARRALIARANSALNAPLYTVVDKTSTPASGDKHDYMSTGPYWWPDPTKPDGLPYIRRDGQINPQRATQAYDQTDFSAMASAVSDLGFAYRVTGERRYADKASQMVRTWFLDPQTRMNPNLSYAQGIPGRVTGRAEGVIDAHHLPKVIEAIGLIGPSGAWSGENEAALQKWFSDLLIWMVQSPIGQEESAKTNNHGLYWDMMASYFALYAGMEDAARTILSATVERRFHTQFAANGTLPEEITRTRSLHYSAWTLSAALDMAQLGDCLGLDLWNSQGPSGQSLRKSVSFMAGFAGETERWPFPETNKNETSSLYDILRRGALGWGDPSLVAAAERARRGNENDIINLYTPALQIPLPPRAR
jgi:hypothetical protein